MYYGTCAKCLSLVCLVTKANVCLSGRTDENKWITQNTAEDNNKSLQSVWGYTWRVSKRLVVAN